MPPRKPRGPQEMAPVTCPAINREGGHHKGGKRAGEVCGRAVKEGREFCPIHDPQSRAENIAKLEAAGRRCTANVAGTGVRCESAAIKGGTVCRFHGGTAPQVRAKATERLAEEEARKVLARLDVRPVANALEELQKTAGIICAWRDVCARIINKLQETDIRFESQQGLEQLRSEVAIWERSLDRCVVALTGLARVQVDERLASIEELKAKMIMDAFAAALGAALTAAGIRETAPAQAAGYAEFSRRLVIVGRTEAA